MELNLKKFNKEHLLKSRQWMNDRETCRLFGRAWRPFSEEDQKKWFERIGKDKSQLIMAMEADGIYVGNVGLKNINLENKKAEFYILIGDKDFRGRGLGFEATEKFLSLIKKKFDFHKIYLHVAESNLPAIKLYKKLGFKEEGILKDELLRESKFINLIRMAYLYE